jgi:Cys-tRNA(Pro) deacylase
VSVPGESLPEAGQRGGTELDTAATRFLRERGIPFRLAIHAKPALTVAEAAAQRNLRPGQLVKTMVLRLPDGARVAALVPGDRDVDLRLVRAVLGVRRLSWVAREEVLAVTGYPPGAVSPAGIGGVDAILADPALADADEVAISSGVPGAGIRLQASDLLRAIEARLVPISRPLREEPAG